MLIDVKLLILRLLIYPWDKFGRKIYLPVIPVSFYGIPIQPYQKIDNHHVDIRSPCRYTVINIHKIEVEDM